MYNNWYSSDWFEILGDAYLKNTFKQNTFKKIS